MYSKKERGLTLVELMVAGLLGAIVVLTMTTVYVSVVRSGSETLQMSKLNQELSALMGIMVGDIRRAGFNGAVNTSALSTNPFSQVDSTTLEVIDSKASNTQVAANSSSGGECIVYTFDADEDGVLDDIDIFGFRLNSGVVQMRQQGDAANARHDSCANDSDDTWLDVTDGAVVTVETLNFALNFSACLNTAEPNEIDDDGDSTTDEADEADCYTVAPSTGDITTETREITITLVGSLVADPDVRVSLTQNVRVRNDMVRVRA